MALINKYAGYTPYIYFIIITSCSFTAINKTQGLIAFPILVIVIPFLWLIIKPNRKLNFTLGITFVCLSSYLIIAHLTNILNIASYFFSTTKVSIYSWLFIFLNFIMALWIIKNSIKSSI